MHDTGTKMPVRNVHCLIKNQFSLFIAFYKYQAHSAMAGNLFI